MKKCDFCFTVKPEDAKVYNPIVLIDNLWPSPNHEDADPGWFSSENEGEMCGPCMLALTRKSNGIT